MFHRIALLLVGILGCACCRADEPQVSAEELEHFERKIRPLLSQHCYECHSSQAKTVHGGLRLDSAQALAQGGDSGAAIVAGKPAESLLIESIGYDGDFQMPPKGKLSDAAIAELTEWVRRGAPFPATDAGELRSSEHIDFEAGRKFWSFQPAEEQTLPDVELASWPRARVDYFVLAAMERQGLTPAPPADRSTLIRRLCFDLTGLPPTPEQVEQFVRDEAEDAYEHLVERLLESPQYGEKWARWWLDMARYTDQTASWLPQTSEAHLYRDWVVQAFNADLPYNEFIRRQLATDLMPETGPDDLPALGFISLSPTYWKELKLPCEIIKVIVADEWEERVDAVSRTFLGLTVACARCHDHKFDPISSEDYYALAGVFASCRHVERPLISEERYAPVKLAKEQVAELQAEIDKLKKDKPPPQEKIDELVAKIQQIKSSTPDYDVPMANALAEESTFVVRAGQTPQDGSRLDYRPEPRDLPLFIRGNPNRPGPVVPRRFLSVLSDNPQPFQLGSGRLELAEAMTTDAASLTARVIVNRLWLAHFGRGIVDTPSNFGRQGSRPSHPELLDDLAARFMAGGWSIKQLQRELLLSATWQQSSAERPSTSTVDPENRYLSRMNRRRLGFEEWRDAMMSVSGDLESQLGGPAVGLDEDDNRRRTLYAKVNRRDVSPTLMVHDFPDPTQHSPQRNLTVTALQGLFALNGELLARQAQSLVQRLSGEVGDDDRQRIHRAYALLYARPPSARELALGEAYVGQATGEAKLVRWQQYAHVLLAANEMLFID